MRALKYTKRETFFFLLLSMTHEHLCFSAVPKHGSYNVFCICNLAVLYFFKHHLWAQAFVLLTFSLSSGSLLTKWTLEKKIISCCLWKEKVSQCSFAQELYCPSKGHKGPICTRLARFVCLSNFLTLPFEFKLKCLQTCLH